MSKYIIIDEPKTKPYEYLIFNPIMILLIAMLGPLFFDLSPYLQVILSFLWLCINGYLLGSATLKVEVFISVLGIAFWYVSFFVAGVLLQVIPLYSVFNPEAGDISPYAKIVSQGIYFFAMYMLVTKQSVSYELFSYIRQYR